MKPAAFEYQRVLSVAGALEAAADSGGAARYLAGGQTLGPLMNLRLARPAALIDVSSARELRAVAEMGESIRFGAAITHAEIEDGIHPDPINGGMRRVAGGIAYRVVRNRGTIGGSVAHADPSADWLSFFTACDARIHTARTHTKRADHRREVSINAFVLSAYVTSLAVDELVTAVEVPRFGSDARFGYYKLCRKVGEFADAIGAVAIDPRRRYCRVVAGAIGAVPMILNEAAATLAGTARAPTRPDLEAEIARRDPHRDPVKVRMAAVAVRRAVQEALEP